jgi:23S rRNA pseudouridine1911/1915/1917 synthase
MKRRSVDDQAKGKRFDVVATEMLPSLSRAYVHTLIEDGRILLNGQTEKAGYKLRLGDMITTDFELSELEQIPDIDLPVLFENDDVIVVDKPAGVISHSRGKYWDEPSVASFIRQKTNYTRTGLVSRPVLENLGSGGGVGGGIVHRLDRATSGVMICAKNQASLSWLQKQFSQRKVKKIYAAVVTGHLEPKEAIIDMPIERNPKAPATFRVGANGKSATTKYKVMDTSGNYDFVILEPHTGRTHQLRVHLAHQKHPIVGDMLYGGKPAERLFLHAASLEITLPNGERRAFVAPLPAIFETIRTKS